MWSVSPERLMDEIRLTLKVLLTRLEELGK